MEAKTMSFFPTSPTEQNILPVNVCVYKSWKVFAVEVVALLHSAIWGGQFQSYIL